MSQPLFLQSRFPLLRTLERDVRRKDDRTYGGQQYAMVTNEPWVRSILVVAT